MSDIKSELSDDKKKSFEEPKLSFIEPKLIKQGDATKITAGSFGVFYPGSDHDRPNAY